MKEYIDKEALIKELEADFNTDWNGYSKAFYHKDYVDGVRDEYDDVLKIICGIGTTEVQPTKEQTELQLAYNEQMIELREAKRLLKLALEDFKTLGEQVVDMNGYCSLKDNVCPLCVLGGENMISDNDCQWRYADEAMKLLKED